MSQLSLFDVPAARDGARDKARRHARKTPAEDPRPQLTPEQYAEQERREFEDYVRTCFVDQGVTWEDYEPSHPWYYVLGGKPLEPDQIRPVAPTPWHHPEPKVLKKKGRRQLADEARADWEKAVARYRDLLAIGPEALSRYDREIAHGGNDRLGVACSLSYAHNHIWNAAGRLMALEVALPERTDDARDGTRAEACSRVA